jgi:hypothetical protein
MFKRSLTGVMIATLVVVAISAVGASSASAAEFVLLNVECNKTGPNWGLCYENEAGKETCKASSKMCEFEGEQSEEVKGGGNVVFTILTLPQQIIECKEAELEVEIGKIKFLVLDPSSEGTGTIKQLKPLVAGSPTTIEGKLKYNECALTTEPKKKCVVNVTNETVELLGELSSETDLLLKPKFGTTFITIDYLNNGAVVCPTAFAGEHRVTGTQDVEISEPGVLKTSHVGHAVGETLEFFSNNAELAQELTLTFKGANNDPWGIELV